MNYTKSKRTVGSKKNFGKTPKNITTKKTNFKNPLANIPAFMIPEIIQTKSSKFAVAESGGIRGSTTSHRLSGNACIYCAKTGATRKPIFIYDKISFDTEEEVDKRSLLFYARINDYIIMESHKNYIDEDNVGCVNIIVYQLKRNYCKSAKTPFKLVPVFKFYKKFDDDSDFTKHFKNAVIMASDSVLVDALKTKLEEAKLKHLYPAIESAIYKANSDSTSYVFYHGSKIADKNSKL